MTTLSRERADLIDTLAARSGFLRFTARGLTEEQARLTPTVSALSIGGLIKHVTAVEESWTGFILHGGEAMAFTPERARLHAAGFVMTDTETLDGLLKAYADLNAATADLVRTVDLDEDHELPKAPWFEPGARRSNRGVFAHIIGETAQHAGHADIIREAIDGQKTMAA